MRGYRRYHKPQERYILPFKQRKVTIYGWMWFWIFLLLAVTCLFAIVSFIVLVALVSLLQYVSFIFFLAAIGSLMIRER